MEEAVGVGNLAKVMTEVMITGLEPLLERSGQNTELKMRWTMEDWKTTQFLSHTEEKLRSLLPKNSPFPGETALALAMQEEFAPQMLKDRYATAEHSI